jgi:hypothetical protein
VILAGLVIIQIDAIKKAGGDIIMTVVENNNAALMG